MKKFLAALLVLTLLVATVAFAADKFVKFTGTAYGYDGNISVRVTVRDDVITDISASTEESDDSFFFDAKGVVIPAILKKQSPSVDACSGATFSSEGIMGAVRAALESAKN